MIIGKRIKELRLESKLTLLALAKAIGVDKHTIIYWEQEVNEPKASYIVRLAQFFGVSTDYLLGLEDWFKNYNKKPYGYVHRVFLLVKI